MLYLCCHEFAAVVDVIGQHIHRDVTVFDKYYTPLLRHINDEGISVRRRVVEVMNDVVMKQHTHISLDTYVDVIAQLIGKLGDESSIVRTMVISTLRSMWFSTDNGHIDKRLKAESTAVHREYTNEFHALVKRI